MSVRESDTATVLLIHGTGAGDPSDEGDSWWQRGSSFCQFIAHDMSSEGCTVQEHVFHWSGANSERDREEAGSDLLEKLLIPLESQKRSYHLIGHSHGGSVILVALREAVRRKVELPHLKSVSTLGTPFLRFTSEPFTPWMLLPLAACSVFGFFLKSSVATFFKYRREVWADGHVLGILAFIILIVILLSTGGYALVRVFRPLVMKYVRYRNRILVERALATYGPRWLRIWSQNDEAINGLAATLALGGRIIPRSWRWGRSLASKLLWPLVLPFRLGYMLLAAIGDDFIWAEVARRLQGNDIAGNVLSEVTREPLAKNGTPLLLEEDEEALLRFSNAKAAETVGRVRKTLGLVALAERDSQYLVARFGEQLSWGELIHTTYFDNPSVRRLLVDHMTGPKTQTPASGNPAFTTAAPRRLPSGHRIQFATAMLLLFLGTTTGILGDRLFRFVALPYTDDYQVDFILQEAPIEQLALAHENDLIFDWVRSLVWSGKTERATADAMRVKGQEAKALALVGAGLADLGMQDRAAQVWEQALNGASGDRRGVDVAEVAEVLFTEGQAEKARKACEKSRELARQTTSPYFRSTALRKIGAIFAGLGQTSDAEEAWSEALNAARQVPMGASPPKMSVLMDVALTQAKSGKITEAISIIDGEIDDLRFRSAGYFNIARDLVKAGKYDEVVEVTDKVTALDDPRKVVEVLINAGKIDEARTWAQRISPGYFQSESFVLVAHSLRNAGRAREILELADEINDPATKISLLLEAGKVDEALVPAKQVPRKDGGEILRGVAKALARDGRTEDAFALVHQNLRGQFLSRGLAEIGEALSNANRNAEAKRAFDEARDVARQIEPTQRAFTLAFVVDVLLRARRFDIAEPLCDELVALLPNVSPGNVPTKVRRSVIQVFLALHSYEKVMTLTRQMVNEQERSRAQADVAVDLVHLREYRQARIIADMCSDAKLQFETYEIILNGIARAHHPSVRPTFMALPPGPVLD